MGDLIEKPFTLHTHAGVPLRGDIRWEETEGTDRSGMLPAVIVCHGFKAFKDWGPFPAIGRFFARHGFVSIVLNFSHNGIGEAPRKFVEHEKFANNTISLEIADVKTVLDEIDGKHFGCSLIDRRRIAVVGHSRGGAVGIIAGREETRIGAVVAWSTIAHFNRYTAEQRDRWRQKGYVQLHSIGEHSLFRINTSLLDDLEQNAERFNIVNAAAHLGKPLLLVHGTADIPANIREAEELYEAADKRLTEFRKLEGAGHMYGAQHPYREESPTLNSILEMTTNWLQTHLLPEASWN